MYRRVLIPMGIAVWTMVGVTLLGAASATYQKIALERIGAGYPAHWMLPVLPTTGWLVFLGVFLAVRLCSLRGGSRRECLAVGLAPAVLTLIPWVALIVSSGLSSLLVVLGSTTLVGDGHTTLGTALTVRDTTAQVLGLVATCLAATWLWFFMSRQRATEMGTGSHV